MIFHPEHILKKDLFEIQGFEKIIAKYDDYYQKTFKSLKDLIEESNIGENKAEAIYDNISSSLFETEFNKENKYSGFSFQRKLKSENLVNNSEEIILFSDKNSRVWEDLTFLQKSIGAIRKNLVSEEDKAPQSIKGLINYAVANNSEVEKSLKIYRDFTSDIESIRSNYPDYEDIDYVVSTIKDMLINREFSVEKLDHFNVSDSNGIAEIINDALLVEIPEYENEDLEEIIPEIVDSISQNIFEKLDEISEFSLPSFYHNNSSLKLDKIISDPEAKKAKYVAYINDTIFDLVRIDSPEPSFKDVIEKEVKKALPQLSSYEELMHSKGYQDFDVLELLKNNIASREAILGNNTRVAHYEHLSENRAVKARTWPIEMHGHYMNFTFMRNKYDIGKNDDDISYSSLILINSEFEESNPKIIDHIKVVQERTNHDFIYHSMISNLVKDDESRLIANKNSPALLEKDLLSKTKEMQRGLNSDRSVLTISEYERGGDRFVSELYKFTFSKKPEQKVEILREALEFFEVLENTKLDDSAALEKYQEAAATFYMEFFLMIPFTEEDLNMKIDFNGENISLQDKMDQLYPLKEIDVTRVAKQLYKSGILSISSEEFDGSALFLRTLLEVNDYISSHQEREQFTFSEEELASELVKTISSGNFIPTKLCEGGATKSDMILAEAINNSKTLNQYLERELGSSMPLEISKLNEPLKDFYQDIFKYDFTQKPSLSGFERIKYNTLSSDYGRQLEHTKDEFIIIGDEKVSVLELIYQNSEVIKGYKSEKFQRNANEVRGIIDSSIPSR